MMTAQNKLAPTAEQMGAAERRAREFLVAGRFRKARDEIKLLCKIDRPKYLPLLIEANQGLAREMLAKGQVSEAQQVIAYLRTIASPADVRAVELEIAVKSNDAKTVLSGALPLLADPSTPLPESEKRRLAEHLLLTFQPIPVDDPRNAPLAAEIQAVSQALEAVSSGQFERALELFRPVPHGSVLGHWKLFVKGLTAFYRGDMGKAARAFSGLPPDSVAAKAGRPFLLLTGERPLDAGANRQPSEATISHACRLAGQPGLGVMLARAEYEWERHHYQASYKALRESLSGFPSQDPDVLGSLSAFYFNAIFALPGNSAGGYGVFFDNLEFNGRVKNPVEQLLISRMLALYLEREIPFEELTTYWENFLRLEEQLHGANPRLTSLVYGKLGAVGAKPRAPSLFSGPSPVLRDSKGAIEALQKSIALDPANLEAHLALCRVFEAARLAGERNRLLDTMTERFPRNKAVLVQAARGCMDRQAYAKGLGYLADALELDRIDPAIPELMVAAKLKMAQQSYDRQHLDKARQIFAEIRNHSVDNPLDFARGRWGLIIREGLLELLHGERSRGKDLLAQARSAGPAPAAFVLFAHFAFYDFTAEITPAFPLQEELRASKHEAGVTHAAILLRIYNYWRGGPNLSKLGAAEDFIRQYLHKAVKHPFTPAEARILVEQLHPDSCFKLEIHRFVERALKLDKTDPFFRLYDHLLQPPARTPFFGKPKAGPPADLARISEDAARRGDEKTARLARQLLEQSQLPPPAPLPAEEPDDFDEGGEFPDPEASDATAQSLEAMKDVLSMLVGATDAEIRSFRKTFPKALPLEMFDAMVEASRNGMPFPPPPFSSPGNKLGGAENFKPSSPKPDPNQLELFRK